MVNCHRVRWVRWVRWAHSQAPKSSLGVLGGQPHCGGVETTTRVRNSVAVLFANDAHHYLT